MAFAVLFPLFLFVVVVEAVVGAEAEEKDTVLVGGSLVVSDAETVDVALGGIVLDETGTRNC